MTRFPARHSKRQDEEEGRAIQDSEDDRREQDGFRIHSVLNMMVDINSRMLFLLFIFVIISIANGQQQSRRSMVTIGKLNPID